MSTHRAALTLIDPATKASKFWTGRARRLRGLDDVRPHRDRGVDPGQGVRERPLRGASPQQARRREGAQGVPDVSRGSPIVAATHELRRPQSCRETTRDSPAEAPRFLDPLGKYRATRRQECGTLAEPRRQLRPVPLTQAPEAAVAGQFRPRHRQEELVAPHLAAETNSAHAFPQTATPGVMTSTGG